MSESVATAWRVTLSGHVQGLGVRPAIASWAQQLGLMGWVENTCTGVSATVMGPEPDLARFWDSLVHKLPAAARLEAITREPTECDVPAGFEIREATPSGALHTAVPPDRVVCQECLAEIRAAAGRRAGYPFSSCTCCGPRYSIIEAMPYSRSRTTLRSFSLCAACQQEYDSVGDRRFHAETNACPACGPQCWACDRLGTRVAANGEAIQAATQAILQGQIVALRGVGGYQLVVDAANEGAVRRLRDRKGRPCKPLAVMVESVDGAQRLAICDAAAREALCSPAGPIVVMPWREPRAVARAVTFEFSTIGLMLPTSPLHALLLDACRKPLVVTSGNREGEPIAYESADAYRQLNQVADFWLEHDRPIQRPIDDSVVRIIGERPAVWRLGRGLAPLKLLREPLRPMVAVGGHQKTTLAISNGAQAVLGPHFGDLDSAASRERWESQLCALRDLYGVSSVAGIAHDLHPDMPTTRFALASGLAARGVQHHHAHIAAAMVEHGWWDRPVLGLALDGTGFGPDGSIWGGELLLCTRRDFRRLGSLLPFGLPGGERAVREPWRTAVALLGQALGKEQAARWPWRVGRSAEVVPLLDRARFSVRTTSAGRLFDGVAALVLGIEIAECDGHGPMLLEGISDVTADGAYRWTLLPDGEHLYLDWRPALTALVRERERGEPPASMAMRFHRGLALGLADAVQRFAGYPVAFGGGCFQNKLLVELLGGELTARGRQVGWPGLVPVNDGGLALGQLVIAAS